MSKLEDMVVYTQTTAISLPHITRRIYYMLIHQADLDLFMDHLSSALQRRTLDNAKRKTYSLSIEEFILALSLHEIKHNKTIELYMDDTPLTFIDYTGNLTEVSHLHDQCLPNKVFQMITGSYARELATVHPDGKSITFSYDK